MDTSENATVFLIQGQGALDYVRGCSADPARLAMAFGSASRFNEDHNEISIPPLDLLFNEKDATEFVERLRRLGFRVFAGLDCTYIGWRSTVDFPSARQAAEQAADALHPLVDECIRKTKRLVEDAAAKNQYRAVSKDFLKYPESVRTEVSIFLQNSGYKVCKAYDGHLVCGGPVSELIGYEISWYPPKVVRDIKTTPWWKRWRTK